MLRIQHIRTIVMTMVKSFGDDRISIFSGYVAFAMILSLFPFIIFLVSLAGFIGGEDLAQDLIGRGFAMLPHEVMDTLAPVVKETMGLQAGKLLTFGIIGTIWTTTSGVESLRDGLNIAHHLKEQRPFWKRRLQSILFVIAGSLIFLLLAALLIALPIALKWLGEHMFIDPKILFPVQILRIVLSLGLLTGVFLSLFRLLPDTTYRWKKLLPGAVLAAVLWTALASVYSTYLSHFGNYNVTYGSLGGVLATMAFFQLSITVIFIGAELNAALHHSEGVEKALTDEGKQHYKPTQRPHRISTSNAS